MAVKRRSFAQARRAAGFTQESLAERLRVDRTTVARWESGEYSPQPWLRPKIAEALGVSLGALRELVDGAGAAGTMGCTAGVSTELVEAPDLSNGALLAEHDELTAAGCEHDQLSQAMELAGAYAETKAPRTTTGLPQVPWSTDQLAVSTAQAILAGFVKATGVKLTEGLAEPLASLALLSSITQIILGEWEDRLYEQLKSVLGEWIPTVNRRELLRLLRWAATTLAAAHVSGLNTDEQERLARAVALPRRVDAQVIDHIETMLQHCKRQEDALGPQAVLQTVLAQRQLVDGLLTECPDSLRPRLLSVYSSMSTSVGGYFLDLGDAARGMHYKDQARAAAQEARNTELAIYALCTMSYYASLQGKAHTGVDLAAAAQNLTAKTDDHLLQSCVAMEFGMAYAVDGQHKECLAEIDRALTRLVVPADQQCPESPVYWFHEGLVASHQSDCLLRLGKPAEAAASAERGLQMFDTSLISDMAYCTLHLGTARLHCGEIEEAARVIGDGAVLASQSPSVRLTREARAARGRLEPWKDTRAVRELDERLAGVGMGMGLGR
jgi:transcriptional regulator with XRE-family HTH domain